MMLFSSKLPESPLQTNPFKELLSNWGMFPKSGLYSPVFNLKSSLIHSIHDGTAIELEANAQSLQLQTHREGLNHKL
ncbi:MAG: hypothetical protein C0433_06845 [Cyclobacterium sp.]|nr:hypothetical protein [Cyclobacterium sp.]